MSIPWSNKVWELFFFLHSEKLGFLQNPKFAGQAYYYIPRVEDVEGDETMVEIRVSIEFRVFSRNPSF